MRAVIQRAVGASLSIDGEQISGFDGPGLVVLLGVTHTDGPDQVAKVADKIANLRLLRDERSVLDEAAPVMVVSQFTLYGDAKKGRRPSWTKAAPGPVAEPLYEAVVDALRQKGLDVQTGRFGADMQVAFTNDGPVTLILELEAEA